MSACDKREQCHWSIFGSGLVTGAHNLFYLGERQISLLKRPTQTYKENSLHNTKKNI